MANPWTSLLASILALLSTQCGESDDAVEPELSTAQQESVSDTDPLTIAVLSIPRPVAATDQQWHILYELVLENLGDRPVRILRIDVSDPKHKAPLQIYRGNALEAMLETGSDSGGSVIEPGGLAVAFVDLAGPLPGRRWRSPLPESLEHRLAIERDGARREVAGPTTTVANQRALLLSPPLRGSGIGVLGCCNETHRAVLAIDGDLFYAQRFASDFVQVEGESTSAGEPTDNESYFIFEDDVIAAAPGSIVEVRDGIAENVPTEPLPPATIESAPGNYIIQAFDTGEYALYAHLRLGSLQVGVGDRISRGQVLAQVGNTGNSTEPHLHFHVTDRPSPLAADGLPYRFDRFRLDATVDVFSDAPEFIPVPPPNARHGLLPLTGNIVTLGR